VRPHSWVVACTLSQGHAGRGASGSIVTEMAQAAAWKRGAGRWRHEAPRRRPPPRPAADRRRLAAAPIQATVACG